MMIGLGFIVTGLIPIFVSVFGHYSRLIRLLALPFVFFGSIISLTAFCGVSHGLQCTRICC